MKIIVLFIILSQTILLGFDTKEYDQDYFDKKVLDKPEKFIGILWQKGTVVISKYKKISYIHPLHPVLFHNIKVSALKIENYVPDINTINYIEIELFEDSVISNFPCDKNKTVKVLANGELLSCRLSKKIFINNIEIQKGTKVELLNKNKAYHPTFDMINTQTTKEDKDFVPIWIIKSFSLKKDTTISGINCLKESGVTILDNGELVECQRSDAVELEGFALKKGCRVSNINPLQGKENLHNVWDYSCSGVTIGNKTFSIMEFRYFPYKDKIKRIKATISVKREHNLEDLLKGVK